MPTDTAELELAPAQAGESPMKQLAPFDAFRAQAEKLKFTAETLTVTDISDRKGMQLARSTRLSFREIRVAVEHRRKELGEEALRTKQRIDTDAKTMKDFCEAQETRLLEMEQFAEREAARIADEKRAARAAELTSFLSSPVAVDLGTMTDEAYAAMLADAKDAQSARLAREAKEKEEAAAKLKAEAEAREAQRLENIRLQKLADELAETARKEREAAAAALAKEREEAAAKAREAQAKADAEAKKLREEAAERERIASEKAKAEAEKARKEREAIEAKLKAENEAAEARAKRERESREKMEAEIEAKKAAEEKAAAEKAAAEKKAAAAPDKAKLTKLAADIRSLALPTLNADALQATIGEQREKFAAWIEKQAESL